ncbi:MAG: Uma2 family endonuclease [Chloroherpetonaceae bacterium]|nr:Uma2 family endonuclease [Chloroherpetonaceae bacterium]MDW8438577.1 Uma2 family endonuclease [Chloroherpetonaceae bacterium]
MITLKEATAMGINAPWSHQRAIGRLMAKLGTMYYEQKSISLEPLPETMLDEDQTSPVPDLLLYDPERDVVPVIIEVTQTRSVKNDLKKVRELIAETEYGIVEGFVYDYKKNEWHKHKKGIGDIHDKPSFCDALNLDLATLL